MNGNMRFCGTTSVVALLLGAAPAFAQTTGTPAAGGAAQDPSAQGTPIPNQQPLPTPADAVDAAAPSEEIVVTGLRSSVESSQAIKRNSDQIVDAIVAQDIGKLPDLTASAALARVTGVQVNRAAGEAAQVQVRGLPDITTTYNGREIFTAEGRFVQIQDFPAGSVGALEVFKSSTANLIEGGIGGQVNVRSRRPFDFDGLEAFGSLNGVYTDQAKQFDGNGNFLISNRWDTAIGEIGVLVNAAYTKLRHQDSTREQSVVIAPDFNPNAGPAFRYPDAQGLFYGAGNRWRPSATATIQWKPTANLEIYADGLFQGFRSRDTNRYLFSPLFGNVTSSNVQLMEDGIRARSLTATGANRPDGFTGTTQAKTDTYQAAGGAIYSNEGLRVSADVAYTDSTYTQSTRNVDHAFAFSPIRDVSFDVPRGEGGPEFNYRDFDATNLNNFLFRGLYEEAIRATGDDLQARTDVEYETGSSFLTRLQFGLRYDDRNAGRERGDRYLNVEERRIPFSALPLDFEMVNPGFVYDDIQPFRTFVQPTFASIRNNIADLRQVVGFPEGEPPYDPTQIFGAGEKSYTAYGQIRYAFDIGIPVDGLIGLRAIKTETTVSGTSRLDEGTGTVTFSPISATNEYEDYLPNASARFSLADELQLRLAYTETRTRPQFADLNPGSSLAPPGGACILNPNIPLTGPTSPNCYRDITSGNSNLQPLTSTNYDISLEWYFARAGSLTGAVFRRDLNGFITRITTTTVDPVYNQLRTNRPENGGNGRVQGVEVGFAGFLDFDSLPQWARGFGLQANYTYIDGTSELSPVLAASAPGQQRLVGVSKHAYNLVALYERPTFSTRVAYNYRSNWVTAYEQIRDPALNPDLVSGQIGPTLPTIHEGIGILDFSANVTPVPNITIQFDVSNVLGAANKLYRPFDTSGLTFPRQYIYLERLFSLGVRFRF